MPINYKKYHPEWKTRIRPDILMRANNCCEICKVENYNYVFRGYIRNNEGRKIEVFQDSESKIYNATNGRFLYKDYFANIIPLSGNVNQKAVKIVLTIAHLDHDIANNSYDNLKALCQKCHLNYDKVHHATNSRNTRNLKKKQIILNF